jgi:uncharacterized membrane protein
METWLADASTIIGTVVEVMALLIIAYSSVEAFIQVVRMAVTRTVSDQVRNTVYLRYLRWLVAALTFQLAADFAHTAVDASWEQLGRVAAIAIIRTFLGYFLERDMREAAAQVKGED